MKAVDVQAGVTELAIRDGDAVRRDALIERLRGRYGDRVRAGTADPRGFGVVVNATPSACAKAIRCRSKRRVSTAMLSSVT
jgi:hypothetical protein